MNDGRAYVAGTLIVVAFVAGGCSSRTSVRGEFSFPDLAEFSVRVLVDRSSAVVDVGSDGEWSLIADGREYPVGRREMVRVRLDGGGLRAERAGGETLSSETGVEVVPHHPEAGVVLAGRSFRGSGTLLREGGTILVINRLNIEDYLRGVLPHEIGFLPATEVEAAKAQAVAARTYTLVNLDKHRAHGYDLESTTADQVYRGMSEESEVSNRAISATLGEVLTKGGLLVQAYYHSTCGGHTESPSVVWDRMIEPEMPGVPDDDFCSWSRSSLWLASWTVDELTERRSLWEQQGNPAGAGLVTGVAVRGRTPSGRVDRLVVETEGGPFEVRRDRIRRFLTRTDVPGAVLQSSMFTLSPKLDDGGRFAGASAVGRGFGHGAGMCQTGAIGMARKSYTYRQILAHYYPGAHVERHR